MDNVKSLEGLYDSHFHIDEMIRKGSNVEECFLNLFSKGWRGGIDIVTSIEDFTGQAEIVDAYPGIFMSAGLYPKEAEGLWKDKIAALKPLLQVKKVVALGEIGLDRFHGYATPKLQEELFYEQLQLANESRLPVIIHCREAEKDLYSVLLSCPPKSGGVIHCFSSDYSWAKKFVDLGLYISFAGNITFKKNDELRNTASRIPLERILVETDSPYLSPEGFRGHPNNPELVSHVY